MKPNPRIRRNFRTRRFVEAAEAVIGLPAMDMEIPGGGTRASCRIVFENETVIATHRTAAPQRNREIDVLTALAPACPHVPQVLGVHGEVLIQEDVGPARLSEVIWQTPETERPALARTAIAALLEMQRAAQTALANMPLQEIGQTDDWLADCVGKLSVLGDTPSVDPRALTEALRKPATRFVRWDTRAANAAVQNGAVRWFDFEFCGRRHGAEDIAWLIADEVWPLPADQMVSLTESLLTEAEPKDFLDYLSLFATLRIVGRLHTLMGDVRTKGWARKRDILERDTRGRHQTYLSNLCRNGAIMATRHPLTAPLALAFDAFETTGVSTNTQL